jgi:Uma2 family endonuclease
MSTQSPSSSERGPMTLEQWAELPPDRPGELVDGVLVEEEMADYIHDFVVGWLIAMVGSWVLARGGLIASSDAKFGVSTTRGRKPDATVYLPGASRPPPRGVVRVPPSLAIEVVSPTPRDARRVRVEKLNEYAMFSVSLYWIVDPQLRSFEVLELDVDGRYKHALSATDGQLRAIPGCPGLELDLDRLWSLVDELED